MASVDEELQSPSFRMRSWPITDSHRVDGSALSRRAVAHALDRATQISTGVDGPNVALKLLSEAPADLVSSTWYMHGMNGHATCAPNSAPCHVWLTEIPGRFDRAE